MDTTTPTETVVDETSSVDETTLLESNEQETAVEQTDTDSSQVQESDSDSSSKEENKDDDKFANFAKSQGFDSSNLTDGERKALKIAHDNVKAYRKTSNDKANGKKVSEQLAEMSKPKEGDDTNSVVMKELNLLKAKEANREFWDSHQEDAKYQEDMVKVLKQEEKEFGEAAAWRLAKNLPRLLREAKSMSEEASTNVAIDAAVKAERAKLRKAQEGQADAPHASNNAGKASNKITREWIANTYDSKNPEHRKVLDAAINRGDLY